MSLSQLECRHPMKISEEPPMPQVERTNSPQRTLGRITTLTTEEPTCQNWRVSHHHNRRGNPGHCTLRESAPVQIETIPSCKSSTPPYNHQRGVSSHLESRPHVTKESSPLNITNLEEHSHTSQLHRSLLPQQERRLP